MNISTYFSLKINKIFSSKNFNFYFYFYFLFEKIKNIFFGSPPPNNTKNIQKAFNHRARMNSLSSKGERSEDLEKEFAA